MNAPKLSAFGAECRRTSGGVGDTMKFSSTTIPSLLGVRAYVLGRMVNGSQRSYISGLNGSINLAPAIQVVVGMETLTFSATPPPRYALYELPACPPGVVGPLGTVGLSLDGGAEQRQNLATVTLAESNTNLNKLFGNNNSISGAWTTTAIISLPLTASAAQMADLRVRQAERRDRINAALGL